MFQDVQCEQDLGALAFLLDAVESTLKVQPEADLLQSRPRCWVTVQFGDLVEEKRQTQKGSHIISDCTVFEKHSCIKDKDI